MQPPGLCYPMPAAGPVTAAGQRPGRQIPGTPGRCRRSVRAMWAFPGRPDQVREARHVIARWLNANGCTRTDDCLMVLSEFATNAIVHSASRDRFFTVRAEVHAGYCWCECEDAGGGWTPKPPGEDRPHGLQIVEALAGAGNWGVDGDAGGRVAWARLVTG